MPKNKKEEYKKGYSQRKAETRQEVKALFRTLRPSIRIEIPVKDAKPAIPDSDGELVLFVDWKNEKRNVSRGKGLKLSASIRKKLFTQIETLFADICSDELHSLICYELRIRCIGREGTFGYGKESPEFKKQ